MVLHLAAELDLGMPTTQARTSGAASMTRTFGCVTALSRSRIAATSDFFSEVAEDCPELVLKHIS